MSIFVSTGAFKSDSIIEILKIARNYGIRNIELAPGLAWNPNTIDVVRKANDGFNFLIHNYFPTPKESFGLNLASSNERIISNSIEMCMANIDLAAELSIPYYSIHCGFCFDTAGNHLGNSSQKDLERIPIGLAKENFVRSVTIVNEYAKKKGIGLAIENNVVAEYVAQEPDMFLGVTTDDMVDLLAKLDSSNIKILLDLAHAKVSDTFLGFGLEKMVQTLRRDVVEVHISDNDGHYDLNRRVSEMSYDIMNCIKELGDKNLTIEVYDLTPEEILQQIELLEKAR